MGVVYKLKAEIKNCILEEKKANPALSCRGLTALIEDKFQIKVSKSSINFIIKEASLSMPVGRRRKKRRRRLAEVLVKPQIESKIEAPTGLLLGPLVETTLGKLPEKPPLMPIEIPIETRTEKPIEVPVDRPAQPPLEAPLREPTPLFVELMPQAEVETQCSGAILLKAADCLIGGSYHITEAIRIRLNREENDLLAKVESLIYLPLFEAINGTPVKELSGLWSLIDKKFILEDLLSYPIELQKVNALSSDISRIISSVFQEVSCVRISLLDGTNFYLDGQLHTVWSTSHLPYSFSITINNIKGYINKYFQEHAPLILFMAPGYDIPTKEFFDFMLNLDSPEKTVFIRLALFGNKLEVLENFEFRNVQKHFFVFGLWPWQFREYRKVKAIGDFKPFYFEPLKKDFYIAAAEIELSQPNVNKKVTLKGCALKTNFQEKTRLLILSNLPPEITSLEELANLYLDRWPNLEEAFQDFSRKIELFTYTANSQRFFSSENQFLSQGLGGDIKGLFEHYLKTLDLYVRWHFLPLGYEDKDFSTIKKQFYGLKASFKKQKDHILVTFQPPSDYPLLKDLRYAVNRINERKAIFPDGKRLWLSV